MKVLIYNKLAGKFKILLNENLLLLEAIMMESIISLMIYNKI
jgi:hypothetical protein